MKLYEVRQVRIEQCESLVKIWANDEADAIEKALDMTEGPGGYMFDSALKLIEKSPHDVEEITDPELLEIWKEAEEV